MLFATLSIGHMTLHQSKENVVRLCFISVLQFQMLMETGSLYLGPLHSSFLNVLFWTIRKSPVTICPWLGSVNDDGVQLQGKLFILSKMSLISNVFINSLWLNILDYIVLVNAYTIQICSVLLNCVVKFFFTFLSFIILVMSIMSMPLFRKCQFFGLVLVIVDAGGLQILDSIKSNVISYHYWLGNESYLLLRKS